MALCLGSGGGTAASAQPVGEPDPPGRVGRLVELQGVIWLYDQQSNEWISRPHNWPVTSGDRVRTEPEARAEIHVGSTTLRLGGGVELSVQRLDDEHLAVQLDSGSLALRITQPEPAGATLVITAEGRWTPQQPGHYRVDRSGDASLASVWRGELWFDGSDSRLSVAAGRRVEVWLQGPRLATHYRWAEVLNDAFAEWVTRDEQALAQAPAAQYVSTEMTGWQDLDRHGSWAHDAELGGVWIPATVAVGWAPYRFGQWAWVAPWGWTWVDATPWGFAPFHYGRWVMWRGRWAWAPGHRVHRPVYAPALVAWIGAPALGFGLQLGSIGRPPPVGWVPLAPWEPYRPHYRAGDRYGHQVNLPHRRVLPPPPKAGPAAPAAPIKYANQGVPGAVTLLPHDAFVPRRPVAPHATPADAALASVMAGRSISGHAAPPAPPQPRVAVSPPAPAQTLPAPAPSPSPSPAAQAEPGHALTGPARPVAPAQSAVAPISPPTRSVPPPMLRAPIVAPPAPGQVMPPAPVVRSVQPATPPAAASPAARPPAPAAAPLLAPPATPAAPAATGHGSPDRHKPPAAKPDTKGEAPKSDAAARDNARDAARDNARESEGRQRTPESRHETRDRQANR